MSVPAATHNEAEEKTWPLPTYHMGHCTSSANLSIKACCPAGSSIARLSGGRGKGEEGGAVALITALQAASFMALVWELGLDRISPLSQVPVVKVPVKELCGGGGNGEECCRKARTQAAAWAMRFSRYRALLHQRQTTCVRVI